MEFETRKGFKLVAPAFQAALVRTVIDAHFYEFHCHLFGAIRKYVEVNRRIFVGGTGNPYFTTDTAAALRANEIDADAILKATKVDGVYDKDPMVHDDAVKFDELPYTTALKLRLRVMDATAFAMCQENNMPVMVFNLNEEGSIRRAVLGEKIGTLVH